MPLEFDNNNQHCTALVNGVQYSSVVSEVVITTNDTSHMSEALIDGQIVAITEAEADALTVGGAQDKRHHTLEKDDTGSSSVI
jgi:hypothetical protein